MMAHAGATCEADQSDERRGHEWSVPLLIRCGAHLGQPGREAREERRRALRPRDAQQRAEGALLQH